MKKLIANECEYIEKIEKSYYTERFFITKRVYILYGSEGGKSKKVNI